MKKTTVVILAIMAVLVLAIDGLLFVRLRTDAARAAAESAAPTAESASPTPTVTPTPAVSETPTPSASEPPAASAEPTETPVTVSPSPSLDPDAEQAAKILAGMSQEEKLYQLFFVTPESLTGVGTAIQAGDATRQAIEAQPVGGIIYFAQNLQSGEQVTSMIENSQTYAMAACGIPLFIGVDEEGGTVARLASTLGTTSFPAMRTYGDAGDTDAVYEVGQTLAADLSRFGFNVDFAPDADVLVNPDNTAIGSRSFGSDAQVVSAMVAAEVQGLQDGGVIACPKHFPGHGATAGDTHNGTAVTNRTLAEMQDCELQPFQTAMSAGMGMLMVGHMTATALDEVPCSVSKAVITELLRGELGYDGVVITDAMNMQALTNLYPNGEAALRAFEAGADMLLCVPDLQAAHDAIAAALESGEVTQARLDESVLRILTLKVSSGLLQ